MNNFDDKDLEFVVRHYRKGHLDTNKAWRSFMARSGRTHVSTFRRTGIAAAITLFLGISAALAFNWDHIFPTEHVSPLIEVRSDVVILKYDNEPIGNVLKELSAHYGKDLRTSDPTRRISGEMEATSLDEIVDILESTLNINITVE